MSVSISSSWIIFYDRVMQMNKIHYWRSFILDRLTYFEAFLIGEFIEFLDNNEKWNHRQIIILLEFKSAKLFPTLSWAYYSCPVLRIRTCNFWMDWYAKLGPTFTLRIAPQDRGSRKVLQLWQMYSEKSEHHAWLGSRKRRYITSKVEPTMNSNL